MGQCGVIASLTEHRFDLGNGAAHQPDPGGIVELSTLLLNMKVEQFFLQIASPGRQFIVAEFFKFFDLHLGR